MTSLRKIEIGFAALLVLTIATKLTATRSQDGVDRDLFAASVTTMLAERGYDTSLSERPSGKIVEADKGNCHILVREYKPDGTFATAIAEQARAIGSLHFAYRGELLGEAPKIRPLIEYYTRRGAQRFGLTPPRAPIVAVAASPDCDIAALPWDRLATLPR